jgi:pyruvate formate-lyase activating enzyme-like uncharacterized protein
LNLNELEIGDSNFDWIKKNYSLNEDTYTVENSISIGKKIIKKFSGKVNVHLCTARTKNWYQFRNRLKKYSQKKILQKNRRRNPNLFLNEGKRNSKNFEKRRLLF